MWKLSVTPQSIDAVSNNVPVAVSKGVSEQAWPSIDLYQCLRLILDVPSSPITLYTVVI